MNGTTEKSINDIVMDFASDAIRKCEEIETANDSEEIERLRKRNKVYSRDIRVVNYGSQTYYEYRCGMCGMLVASTDTFCYNCGQRLLNDSGVHRQFYGRAEIQSES